jgi:hypothetical protein
MHAALIFTGFVAAVSALVVPAPDPTFKKALQPKSLIGNFLDNACNVQKAVQPTAPTPLPAPTGTLALVAIGRGTQNYTCADDSATPLPVQIGALATLYNASCIEGSLPGMLAGITEDALSVPETALAGLPSVGEHFFVTTTTPSFNIPALGFTECSKIATSPAPANTKGDVAWLYLTANSAGTTSKIVNVFRLETAGGAAPANCSGQPANIEVQYAAEYWFYTS